MKTTKIIFLILCFPVNAFPQTHVDFVCPNHLAARQCNQHCKTTERKRAFLIDQSTSSIMVKHYGIDNKISSSHVIKNCLIFSDKDWRCENMTPTGYRKFILQIATMADGIFSNEVTTESTPSDVSNELPQFSFNFCARPIR